MNELTQRLRTFLKVAEHQSFNAAAPQDWGKSQ
ncbi:LysR family transcriptional regulator [Cobetia sp. ICG0124]|nr:LysR family transcriptional regulator [Cobetia sp. ICG0124]